MTSRRWGPRSEGKGLAFFGCRGGVCDGRRAWYGPPFAAKSILQRSPKLAVRDREETSAIGTGDHAPFGHWEREYIQCWMRAFITTQTSLKFYTTVVRIYIQIVATKVVLQDATSPTPRWPPRAGSQYKELCTLSTRCNAPHPSFKNPPTDDDPAITAQVPISQTKDRSPVTTGLSERDCPLRLRYWEAIVR